MVVASAIRHLATANNSDTFLAALFKNTVMVWDINTGVKVSAFETILDFGGDRLAFAPNKGFCIAGAYNRHGIACYLVSNGEKLWQRKDLKCVQNIQISPNEKSLFCHLEYMSDHIIDLDTGDTIEKLRGIRAVYYDPYESWVAHHKQNCVIFDTSGKKKMTIQLQNSHILDMAFSRSHIALTIGGNGVCFVLREDNDKVIRCNTTQDSHVLRLAYTDKQDVFYGVEYNGRDDEKQNNLIKYNLLADESVVVTSFTRDMETEFCDYGNHLITSKGLYINTKTGEIEREFDFPMKEYNT